MNTPIIQPDVMIAVNGLKLGEVGITPYLDFFETISQEEGSPNANLPHWTESGVNPGITFTYKRWSLDFIYFATFLPSGTGPELESRGAIGQAQELDITLQYDDALEEDLKVGPFKYHAGQFFPIALNPHILYVREFEDRTDSDLNQYLEFGIEPSLSLGDKWTIDFPTVLGCSLDGYYVAGDGHNDFFGYIGSTARLTYQISEHWDIHGGVAYNYNLSGGLCDYNSDYNGDGSRHSFVGFLGVGFSY